MSETTVRFWDQLSKTYKDVDLGKASAPTVVADADITQLITVVAAGTPVRGPNKESVSGWWMRTDPSNTGYVTAMFHGQTKATKGFPLDSAMPAVLLNVSNLSDIDFDASVNDSKIWLIKA